MIRGLYIAGSALLAENRTEQAIAQNMDNLSTPGYQAISYLEETVPVQAIQVGSSAVGPLATSVAVAGQTLSTAPGTMQVTGRALDIALPAGVYLTVQTPTGTAYTRDGSLSVDASGRLVDAGGNLVLGTGGQPILVGSETGAVISQDGQVTGSTGKVAGTLGLVQFARPSALLPVSAGVLDATTASGPAAKATGALVHPGVLEDANVSLVQQMVQALSAFQAYGLNEDALNSASTTLQLAVQDVGKVV